jgi:cytoskeletal protein CcmA (bactofilin family)
MKNCKKSGYIKGDLEIDGNLILTGDLEVEGNIDVSGYIDCRRHSIKWGDFIKAGVAIINNKYE